MADIEKTQSGENRKGFDPNQEYPQGEEDEFEEVTVSLWMEQAPHVLCFFIFHIRFFAHRNIFEQCIRRASASAWSDCILHCSVIVF